MLASSHHSLMEGRAGALWQGRLGLGSRLWRAGPSAHGKPSVRGHPSAPLGSPSPHEGAQEEPQVPPCGHMRAGAFRCQSRVLLSAVQMGALG